MTTPPQEASGAAKASDSLPSPLAAVDDMRATAQWTLVVVGAVGAALISGGPLVAVGQVHGVAHAVVAGVGLIVALAGVVLAIWFTSKVLTPRLTTPGAFIARKTKADLASLTASIDEEPSYFFGVVADNVSDLLAHYAKTLGAIRTLTEAIGAQEDPTVRDGLEKQLAQVQADEDRVDSYMTLLLPLAHAWLVQADLRRSRLWTLAGGMLVVIGAVLFFSVAGSSTPTYVPVMTPAVTSTPASTATPVTTATP